jgi:chaperonin subunit
MQNGSPRTRRRQSIPHYMPTVTPKHHDELGTSSPARTFWSSRSCTSDRSTTVSSFNAERLPMDAKAGDTILFGKYSGQEVRVDGIDYLIMKENDVFAIEGRSL